MTQPTKKTVDEVIDYEIDWSTTLNKSVPADTIATSVWAADQGLVVDSETETDTTATVWVSGGTVDTYVNLTNTITTVGGRTLESTIVVNVVETVAV